MARNGISREEVFEAAERLSNLQERVTVTRVRELLGNTGSYSTISQYLKEWRGEVVDDAGALALDEATRADIERNALGIVRAFWHSITGFRRRLVSRVNGRILDVEREYHDAESRIAAMAAQIKGFDEGLARLHEEMAGKESALAQLSAEYKGLQGQIAALNARVLLLEQRTGVGRDAVTD